MKFKAIAIGGIILLGLGLAGCSAESGGRASTVNNNGQVVSSYSLRVSSVLMPDDTTVDCVHYGQAISCDWGNRN